MLRLHGKPLATIECSKILQKILRILTNVNILQETLKNIESFAIIEQLQDVDKYE